MLMRKFLFADQRQKQNNREERPAGSSPRIVPMERRNWIDIEPGKYSLSAYEVSKKVINSSSSSFTESTSRR